LPWSLGFIDVMAGSGLLICQFVCISGGCGGARCNQGVAGRANVVSCEG